MGRLPIQIRGMPYPFITAFPYPIQAHPELKSALNKSILLVIKIELSGFCGLAGAVTGIAQSRCAVLLIVFLVSLLSGRRAQCKTGQCLG